MRVTQNQITRQYLNNSNSALDNMNRINDRVLSQRKFVRASEDPVGAARALVIRGNLEKCDTYLDNLDTAEGIYSTAEKSLLRISEVSVGITDSIILGTNGTQGPDERKIIAEQIRNMAKEMISQANTDLADRRIFGGTNTTTTPFVYDEATGVLNYNGTNIDSAGPFPQSKDISVDVGIGIKFDAAGDVDSQTVMNLALKGNELLGYGTDADGDSKNLIKLAYDAADAIESNDKGRALNLLEKVKTAKTTLMIGITNIGNLEQSVKYNRDRVEDQQYNLQVAQKSVEGADITEEITKLKVAEMAYNATLSMGSSVIPRSIFDFI